MLRQADTETLETLFRALGEGLDPMAADPARERLFLAKLALVLAGHIGDAEVLRAAIAMAGRDL